MRTALAIFLALFLASPAAAADLTLNVAPREGAIFGEEHRFSGALTQGGRPVSGQVVLLEGRPHPFRAAFEVLDRTVTDAAGRYAFLTELERNHQVRLRSEGTSAAPAASSRIARAYVFPSARLSARTVRRNVVRLTQTLTVPPDVVLKSPTRFYLGRARAATAAFVETARPRRVRAGRFIARVTVRVPVEYEGRFSYAACFRSTPGAGVGDPKAGCPARAFRF